MKGERSISWVVALDAGRRGRMHAWLAELLDDAILYRREMCLSTGLAGASGRATGIPIVALTCMNSLLPTLPTLPTFPTPTTQIGAREALHNGPSTHAPARWCHEPPGATVSQGVRVSDPVLIRILMRIAGPSGREISRTFGWSGHSYLNRIVAGEVRGPLATAVRLAEFLQVPVHRLFEPADD